jgi:signal peptidase II
MLYILSVIGAAALLALDQWLKLWITANLPLGETLPLWPGVVQLCTVHNYGAAWSSFSGQRWFLLAVTCVIVGAVAVVLTRRIVRHPLGVIACCLILSGGIGNIIDRFRLGYVVDMFHLEFWPSYPVFNVADICVVVGGIALCVYCLFFYDKYEGKGGKKHDKPTADR